MILEISPAFQCGVSGLSHGCLMLGPSSSHVDSKSFIWRSNSLELHGLLHAELFGQATTILFAINSTSTQHDAWAGARIQENEALVTLLCRASHGAIIIQDSKDQFVMRALVPSCSLDLPLVALNVQNLNPGPCADTTQTCAPQFEASAVPTSITSIPLSLHKKALTSTLLFQQFLPAASSHPGRASPCGRYRHRKPPPETSQKSFKELHSLGRMLYKTF